MARDRQARRDPAGTTDGPDDPEHGASPSPVAAPDAPGHRAEGDEGHDGTHDDDHEVPDGHEGPAGAAGGSSGALGDGPTSTVGEAEAEAADQAVAEAIARYATSARPVSAREEAVRHAAHESMAAIEKFLGLAKAAGSPGREPVWVGRVLKRRVRAWQLVYDFDADFAYVARMDRGIYLTAKGKLLFTVGDSKPLRRRVAWKVRYDALDAYMARFAGEHDVLKVPLLHHRRLLDGIARVCAQQHLDWG